MSGENREIVHRDGAFFIEEDGKRVAQLTYAESGGDAIVDHTWVDPAIRGGGDARRLVESLVAWARANNRRIVPHCSYVRAVIRGSDYDDVRKG